MTDFNVSSQPNFAEQEAEISEYWRDRGVFSRWMDHRPDAPFFVVREKSTVAICSPGIQYVLDSVFRNVISRYRTMKGYRVAHQDARETGGLPVEATLEQRLSLSPNPDAEGHAITGFNRRCRESVFQYVKDWTEIGDRLGCWVDTEVAFDTLETDQVETGWWMLKQLWDQGLLYRDLRATPHCPRCVYGRSSPEWERSYREYNRGPSVFVRFEATAWPEAAPTYFLGWTTAPWTLPGNTALAVDAGAEYSVVATGDCQLVLATALLDVLKEAHTVVKTVLGSGTGGPAVPSSVRRHRVRDLRTPVREARRNDSTGGLRYPRASCGGRRFGEHAGGHWDCPHRVRFRCRRFDAGPRRGTGICPAC